MAPSITWLLVSTMPSSVRTIPVPAASPPSDNVVLMFTTAALTLSVTLDVSTDPLLFDDTIAGGDDELLEPPSPPLWPRPNAVTNTTAAMTNPTIALDFRCSRCARAPTPRPHPVPSGPTSPWVRSVASTPSPASRRGRRRHVSGGRERRAVEAGAEGATAHPRPAACPTPAADRERRSSPGRRQRPSGFPWSWTRAVIGLRNRVTHRL